jgi:hypothetical protein
MMKVIAVLAAMAAVSTGIAYAAPAHADPPPICTAPPTGAPITTPECNACITAHLFDRDGLYRECLGGNPAPVPPGFSANP